MTPSDQTQETAAWARSSCVWIPIATLLHIHILWPWLTLRTCATGCHVLHFCTDFLNTVKFAFCLQLERRPSCVTSVELSSRKKKIWKHTDRFTQVGNCPLHNSQLNGCETHMGPVLMWKALGGCPLSLVLTKTLIENVLVKVIGFS